MKIRYSFALILVMAFQAGFSQELNISIVDTYIENQEVSEDKRDYLINRFNDFFELDTICIHSNKSIGLFKVSVRASHTTDLILIRKVDNYEILTLNNNFEKDLLNIIEFIDSFELKNEDKKIKCIKDVINVRIVNKKIKELNFQLIK